MLFFFFSYCLRNRALLDGQGDASVCWPDLLVIAFGSLQNFWTLQTLRFGRGICRKPMVIFMVYAVKVARFLIP